MIKVLTPGFYSSIQDHGRFDFQNFGVPISGVMDSYSARIANALVGNNEEAAVLEITMSGPKLEFLEETLVSIAGACISPMLNDIGLNQNTAVKVSKGDILTFGKLQYGFRAYLAVLGGFRSKTVLGSKSMYKGITEAFRIQKSDVLEFPKATRDFHSKNNASIKINKNHFENTVIEVFKGPEYERLTKEQKQQLESMSYTVAKENSRMAYQLEDVLKNDLEPIITSLVLPGTIQLTPSGKLIILMRDCQTTGGYPRILQLNDASIDRLAQKYMGSRIRFKILD